MAKNINAKGRRQKSQFLALPHEILRSPAYRSLSPSAVKLLVDVGLQFNGRNNGNLSICMSEMRKQGWRSTATLNRAKKELLAAGLLEQTRQGGLNMGPNLFALTWQSIDECPRKDGRRRHDVNPTNIPSGKWKHFSASRELEG